MSFEEGLLKENRRNRAFPPKLQGPVAPLKALWEHGRSRALRCEAWGAVLGRGGREVPVPNLVGAERKRTDVKVERVCVVLKFES